MSLQFAYSVPSKLRSAFIPLSLAWYTTIDVKTTRSPNIIKRGREVVFSLTCQVDIGVERAAPLQLFLTKHPRLTARAHLVHRVTDRARLARNASSTAYLHRGHGPTESESVDKEDGGGEAGEERESERRVEREVEKTVE